MSDDLIQLYSSRILALAADMPRTGRLDAPEGSARVRSPLCGSTVTVDLCLNGGVVSDYAQDVKACALGQAAAAVVGAHVVGCDEAAIRRGRNQLAAMLERDGPVPDAPWQGFEVLRPAVAFPNRHPSILLALDATLKAIAAAKAAR